MGVKKRLRGGPNPRALSSATGIVLAGPGRRDLTHRPAPGMRTVAGTVARVESIGVRYDQSNLFSSPLLIETIIPTANREKPPTGNGITLRVHRAGNAEMPGSSSGQHNSIRLVYSECGERATDSGRPTRFATVIVGATGK
jgi:hypothetical protein